MVSDILRLGVDFSPESSMLTGYEVHSGQLSENQSLIVYISAWAIFWPVSSFLLEMSIHELWYHPSHVLDRAQPHISEFGSIPVANKPVGQHGIDLTWNDF